MGLKCNFNLWVDFMLHQTEQTLFLNSLRLVIGLDGATQIYLKWSRSNLSPNYFAI